MSLIILAIQLVAIFKRSTSRYVIREWFSSGELNILKFGELIWRITPRQVLGLGLIASFTLLSFPLGVWMGSFKMGEAYAIRNLVGSFVNLLTLPFTLWTMKNLNEFVFNNETRAGLGIIVLAKILIIIGTALLYLGNEKT
jgi:hypothetical protein